MFEKSRLVIQSIIYIVYIGSELFVLLNVCYYHYRYPDDLNIIIQIRFLTLEIYSKSQKNDDSRTKVKVYLYELFILLFCCLFLIDISAN